MTFLGKVLYPAKQNQESVMKLTEQEKRLVSILEIIQVEQHAPRNITPVSLSRSQAFLTSRLCPVRSWPNCSTVIRRPVTCSVSCNLHNQPAQDMWVWNCRFFAVGGHLFEGLRCICRRQPGERGALCAGGHILRQKRASDQGRTTGGGLIEADEPPGLSDSRGGNRRTVDCL